MNNLYIISKQEFTSLYRFGKIPINKEDLLFIKGCNKETKDDILFKAFLKKPFFDSDEEYLILSLDFSSEDKSEIKIEDLSEIIPLTPAAKASFEMKFSTNILFQEAKYNHIASKVEQHIDLIEMKNGSKSLINLHGLKVNELNFVNELVLQKAQEHQYKGNRSDGINEVFFVHLLVYDRYEFFPKNCDLGFFYDVGEIFAHFKGAPSFKPSNLFKYFESNKDALIDKRLSELIDIFEEENEVESFKNQLTNNGLKHYFTGVLYLYFKNELKSTESIFETSIPKIIPHLENRFSLKNEAVIALQLVGAFYRYEKFYGDLYKTKNLQFFKSTIQSKVSETKEIESIISNKVEHGAISSKNDNERTDQFDKLKKFLDTQKDRGNKKQFLIKLINSLSFDDDFSSNLRFETINEAVSSENELKNKNGKLCAIADKFVVEAKKIFN